MKILVVSQYFWPENFKVNDLVQELVSRGHEVTVLTGYPNYPGGAIYENFRSSPEKYENFTGARICRVPLLARGKGGFRLVLNYLSFMLSAALLGPVKLRGQTFEVIFVFEPSPVTVGIPAIIISKLKKIPVVFWVLDLWPETLAAMGVVRSKRLLMFVGWMVRYIYNRCELVLGQSKGFVGNIAKYCDDREKIRYFPSWAEDIYSHHQTTQLASEVPVQEGLFNVLFAGNIGEAQDFPAILDAAEHLKNNSKIRWLIVGDGRMSEWLEHEVRIRGLEKSVLLMGRFPNDRMPSFYAHADALLVSLKADPVFSLTIPGKMQSYLMSGIPIVAMLDGEGADVVRESQSGIACSAGNGADLAQAVLKVFTMNKQERNILGENGRNYAKKEFDRHILIDRLVGWLMEVSSKQKGT